MLMMKYLLFKFFHDERVIGKNGGSVTLDMEKSGKDPRNRTFLEYLDSFDVGNSSVEEQKALMKFETGTFIGKLRKGAKNVDFLEGGEYHFKLGFVVSQQVKDIIEQVDHNCHEYLKFIPVMIGDEIKYFLYILRFKNRDILFDRSEIYFNNNKGEHLREINSLEDFRIALGENLWRVEKKHLVLPDFYKKRIILERERGSELYFRNDLIEALWKKKVTNVTLKHGYIFGPYLHFETGEKVSEEEIEKFIGDHPFDVEAINTKTKRKRLKITSNYNNLEWSKKLSMDGQKLSNSQKEILQLISKNFDKKLKSKCDKVVKSVLKEYYEDEELGGAISYAIESIDLSEVDSSGAWVLKYGDDRDRCEVHLTIKEWNINNVEILG